MPMICASLMIFGLGPAGDGRCGDHRIGRLNMPGQHLGYLGLLLLGQLTRVTALPALQRRPYQTNLPPTDSTCSLTSGRTS